jgi:hypothetical protein
VGPQKPFDKVPHRTNMARHTRGHGRKGPLMRSLGLLLLGIAQLASCLDEPSLPEILVSNNMTISAICPEVSLMANIFSGDVTIEAPRQHDLDDLMEYEWSRLDNATSAAAFLVCTEGRRAGG